MKSKPEIVVIGAAIVDLPLCPVGRDVFDRPSSPVEQMSMTVGGDAINEATILTRLGHAVRLVSALGNDPAGSFVLEHCRKNHIDSSFLAISGTLTTSINVPLISADGERSVITNRSGSLWQLCLDDLDLSCLEEGSLLSFASIFNNPRLDEAAMLQIFSRAKARGMTICADMVSPRFHETVKDIRRALAYVDYFFPNYEEACELTGLTGLDEIADCFLGCGVKNVVIKIGRRGAFVKNARECFTAPIYPKANCLDTTGAGDNFASGFIAALLEGRTLRECAEFANVTASIAIEAVGATTALQSRAQADERYEEYRNIYLGEAL